mmetsp:Transcript_17910/g.30488  ORF Transcript_17910/g.30488 Transcript_17910/m.30488 type:complete len:135 (-) Transcript_17910:180-584(-)|eukprot:CAMPEP_0116562750 /NCGR_PEP_ID=MMETSP0397-20121206/12342_1 /TAXON_ID=216820 /ORGANISM="Cyclophora tenuis, Strain ECT3854" /LENGTH=134 /DNA_ID=CAMNT_0004089099 /DNA_START=703 /DNA_END=1107 /DNA_ORIENTATION=+
MNPQRIQSTDILCDDKTSILTGHEGNRQLDRIIEDLLRAGGPDHQNRAALSLRAILTIRQQTNARFLAKTGRGTWKEMGNDFAQRWLLDNVLLLEDDDDEISFGSLSLDASVSSEDINTILANEIATSVVETTM